MLIYYFTHEQRTLISKYLSENNPIPFLSEDAVDATNRIEDFLVQHRINNVLSSMIKDDGYKADDFRNYIKYLEIKECLFPKYCKNLVFHMYVTATTILKVLESYGRLDFKAFEKYLYDQDALFIFNTIVERYSDLLPYIIDRLDYFDPTLQFKDCMSKLGLNDIDLLKRHNIYKNSKLRPFVLLNYIDRDQFNIKEQYRIQDATSDKIDLYLWLSHYKQWYDSSTTFNYKGVDIKLHNHTVAKYIDVPYKDGKFDMSKHPSKCIGKSLDMELNRRYTITNTKFDLPYFLQDDEEFRFLRTGLDMLNEGQTMNNCIGGLNYINRALKENYYYAHMNSPDCEDGITIEFAPGTIYSSHNVYIIGQAHRKSNKDISEYERDRVNVMLAHINSQLSSPSYGIDEKTAMRIMYGI